MPRLARVWNGQVEPLDAERLARTVDVAFLAVPEKAAAELAPPLVDAGVRVIDGQTKKTIEFQAKLIFLCASTIESARILLNSEGNLANSSGQVGKNLMDHIMGGGASARIDAPADAAA